MAKKIREIMHKHTFVPASMTISDVAKLMLEKRIGSVLITSI